MTMLMTMDFLRMFTYLLILFTYFFKVKKPLQHFKRVRHSSALEFKHKVSIPCINVVSLRFNDMD